MRKNISPFRKKDSEESKVLKKESIRLNKFIANNTDLTRREADKLILNGNITVNDTTVKEPGIQISEGDIVLNNGKILSKNTCDYILLNKPRDIEFEKSNKDTKLCIGDLIKKATNSQLYPVAALSTESSGVQLMTNDLDLNRKLEDKLLNKKVVYFIKLTNEISEDKFYEIKQGFTVNGCHIKPIDISFSNPESKSEIGMEINSISLDTVFSLFKHFEVKISQIDRVYYAGLSKKGLQRSHWRHLKPTEVAALKMGSYE